MEQFPFFSGFTYRPILGGHQYGVTRRDPSPVIQVGETYYVWYTRTKETKHGYTGSIWYATSSDGLHWEEQTEAIPKGGAGSFDEQAVFTPSILVAGNKYYLSYTAVPAPFSNDPPNLTPSAIGMAFASDPAGPWTKLPQPILKTSDDPQQFDSIRVDDTCFVVKDGMYFMYYKGRQWQRTPQETKMGLAIAQEPTGPYVKHESNPVLNSGHEVCVWPHGQGVGCLVSNIGPQGRTIQYSDDGVHFQCIGKVSPPAAPGPYREDQFVDGQGPGIRWGISMSLKEEWPYLVRFDCDLRS